jgi:hypothetical protein
MMLRIAVVLIATSMSLVWADDIRTIDGKQYQNATVTRAEPDGLVISYSEGIVKIPFTELNTELQQKYHYDPEIAKKFAAEDERKQLELYNQIQAQKAAASERAAAVAAQAQADREAKENAAREQAAEAVKQAAIKHGPLFIGMSEQQCIAAVGSPEVVNTTTTVDGKRAEWVDPAFGLYFDEKGLTSVETHVEGPFSTPH